MFKSWLEKEIKLARTVRNLTKVIIKINNVRFWLRCGRKTWERRKSERLLVLPVIKKKSPWVVYSVNGINEKDQFGTRSPKIKNKKIKKSMYSDVTLVSLKLILEIKTLYGSRNKVWIKYYQRTYIKT